MTTSRLWLNVGEGAATRLHNADLGDPIRLADPRNPSDIAFALSKTATPARLSASAAKPLDLGMSHYFATFAILASRARSASRPLHVEQEGIASRRDTVPVLDDETQWRAALVQAVVF
jgi:hypothetical protein